MEDGLQRKRTPKLHSKKLEKREMLVVLSPQHHLALISLKLGMMRIEHNPRRCRAQLVREGKKQTAQVSNGTSFPQIILLKLV